MPNESTAYLKKLLNNSKVEREKREVSRSVYYKKTPAGRPPDPRARIRRA